MWRLENPLLTVYFVANLVVRHLDRALFLSHVFAGISGIIVGCGIGHVSIEQVTSKLIPYFAALVAALLAVTYIPALSLGLPSLMGLI